MHYWILRHVPLALFYFRDIKIRTTKLAFALSLEVEMLINERIFEGLYYRSSHINRVDIRDTSSRVSSTRVTNMMKHFYFIRIIRLPKSNLQGIIFESGLSMGILSISTKNWTLCIWFNIARSYFLGVILGWEVLQHILQHWLHLPRFTFHCSWVPYIFSTRAFSLSVVSN